MIHKPVYEIVKVTKRKVFIVGLGDPCITANMETVYEELKKICPNKRIIIVDDISQCFEYNDVPRWWELLEVKRNKEMKRIVPYKVVKLSVYDGKSPKIKGWDKILIK